jgi:hypothetical protein
MPLRSNKVAAAVKLTTACLLVVVTAAGQSTSDAPPSSEAVFKNIQLLKGIPVDEFMDTMGMFSSALGYDCSSCHSPEISADRNAFAITTPLMLRTRGMITMMNAINRMYFGGQPRISCFSCHHGSYSPENIPNLALQYGELVEDPNLMSLIPDRNVSVDEVFDKYFQSLGGAAGINNLTSLVLKGTYGGFNTGGGNVPLEIFAKAPNQFAQIVRMPSGENKKIFDGKSGWVAEEWRPLPFMTLTGGNLAGAGIEAMLPFPAAIRKAFSQWKVGTATIDDQSVQVLQGSNAGESPVNLYFDESGLLVRAVFWNKTIVGSVPTQINYADYREVRGLKFPFRITRTWTDGQNNIILNEVQPNVAIDPARFSRPAPFQRR